MTPALLRWLGASVVRHPVYHGTTHEFTVFSFHHGINAPVPEAAYFTDSKALAEYVAHMEYNRRARVLEVYLRIENPLILDAKGAHAIRMTDEVRRNLRPSYHPEPYDGVILQNVREFQQPELTTTYAVFKPAQIKLVHGNETYDPKDPDIRRNPRHRA